MAGSSASVPTNASAGSAPALEGETVSSQSNARMPVVFVPHGGGPWPFVDLGLDRADVTHLADYLRSLHALPTAAPKALLVISSHWEERVPTVLTGEHPPLLYDYFGFPKEAYEVTWPAAGDPALAARVRELLTAGGFSSAENGERGFDHGTFVPFKLTYPEAEVPTVQLSLKNGLDPKEHLAIGRALSPLREEGVFILGSGMSFHNMRAFGDPRAAATSLKFDTWLTETVTLESIDERNERLIRWVEAPAARVAHPRE
jgi:aromatic ring-opening dioxygenase catalytic subunit (LigB family)